MSVYRKGDKTVQIDKTTRPRTSSPTFILRYLPRARALYTSRTYIRIASNQSERKKPPRLARARARVYLKSAETRINGGGVYIIRSTSSFSLSSFSPYLPSE